MTEEVLVHRYQSVNYSVESFIEILNEAKVAEVYKRLPDPEHPYDTWAAWLHAHGWSSVLDAVQKKQLSVRQIVAAIKPEEDLAAWGERGGGHSRVYDVNSAGTGNGVGYLTRRIKRDRPEIFTRMQAGEFKSVRQAAIEAGIVHPPTPLDLLRRAWDKASTSERHEFLNEVSGFIGDID
jgi:hypothetical protein